MNNLSLSRYHSYLIDLYRIRTGRELTADECASIKEISSFSMLEMIERGLTEAPHRTSQDVDAELKKWTSRRDRFIAPAGKSFKSAFMSLLWGV